MLKFVLDDENLVFGYLDEIEVSLDEVVEAIYLRKYPSFTEVVHEKQFEQLRVTTILWGVGGFEVPSK